MTNGHRITSTLTYGDTDSHVFNLLPRLGDQASCVSQTAFRIAIVFKPCRRVLSSKNLNLNQGAAEQAQNATSRVCPWREVSGIQNSPLFYLASYGQDL